VRQPQRSLAAKPVFYVAVRNGMLPCLRRMTSTPWATNTLCGILGKGNPLKLPHSRDTGRLVLAAVRRGPKAPVPANLGFLDDGTRGAVVHGVGVKPGFVPACDLISNEQAGQW